MSNTSDAIADATTYSKTHLAGHIGIFDSNTNIADAMDYSNLPADVRSQIWTDFDAADAVGLPVADLGQPADYPANPYSGGTQYSVEYTYAEVKNSYARYIAHAFWVELFGGFPWSMLSYDLESCQFLLHTDHNYNQGIGLNTFTDWTDPSPSPKFAGLGGFIPYSPRRAWDKATTFISSPRSAKDAVSQIIERHRHFTTPVAYVHGPSPIPPIDATDTYNDLNRLGGTGAYLGHSGCHFSTWLFRDLLRSVNIPSTYLYEKYFGRFHASILFPTLNRVAQHPLLDEGDPSQKSDRGLVINHTDDPYFGTTIAAISGVNMCVNRRYWDAHVTPDHPNSEYKWTYRASKMQNWFWDDKENPLISITHLWNDASGWDHMRAQFAAGLTLPDEQSVMDAFEAWAIAKNGRPLIQNSPSAGAASIRSDDFSQLQVGRGPESSGLAYWIQTNDHQISNTNEVEMRVLANTDHRMQLGSHLGTCAYQFCDNTDCEIEVKWTTAVTGDMELGLGFYSDDDDWIGAAVYDNGSGAYHYKFGDLSKATPYSYQGLLQAGGPVAPFLMKINRTGNLYTASHSDNDGSTWFPLGTHTSTYTMRRAFLYAATKSATPSIQYSPQADYFFENSARISPEDG